MGDVCWLYIQLEPKHAMSQLLSLVDLFKIVSIKDSIVLSDYLCVDHLDLSNKIVFVSTVRKFSNRNVAAANIAAGLACKCMNTIFACSLDTPAAALQFLSLGAAASFRFENNKISRVR